jgi:two-component system, cell cycle sensor histidine kinase and response regulator CckA
MNSALRLLCVEDREDEAELILREIRRGGYQIEYDRVETAEELRAALASEWDAILSDYSMPQFDAVAALRVLQESGKDLPFIIVSGTVGEDIAVIAMKAGAHDFIPKGNLRRLLPALERELREAEGRAERHLAEEQLRQTNEVVAAAFAASPTPMILLDRRAFVLRWNPAAERVFGWRAEEVIGRRIPFIPPGDPFFADTINTLMRGQAVSNREVERKRRDGSSVRILVSAAAIYGNDGVSAIVGILADVTEQRNLEEQLRQAQKMEAVGLLAGGIAHDFNNVLTAIHGYASLLITELPSHDERRQDAQEIIHAAERAGSFTRQLLAFSRKQVIQPARLDLNVIISSMENLLDRMLGDRVTLHVELSGNENLVYADKGQVEQVIINLLVNARDATAGCAESTIRMKTYCTKLGAEDVLALRGETPGDYCVIEVSDTGTGIDVEFIDRIFEPFFTTKEVGKGTGLGLSTVYGIARQNGGFVRVSSAVGHGATFSIFFPEINAGSAVDAPASKPAKDVEPNSSHVILVVEDEDAIRQLIMRVLTRAGHRVLAAADPLEAIRLLEEDHGVDLVLTDLMLPQLSGKELAARVRSIQPGVHIAYMSGYADERMDADVPYLEKPFTPKELITMVTNLFARA